MAVKVIHLPEIVKPKPEIYSVRCYNENCQATLVFTEDDVCGNDDIGYWYYYVICPNCKSKTDFSDARPASNLEVLNYHQTS